MYKAQLIRLVSDSIDNWALYTAYSGLLGYPLDIGLQYRATAVSTFGPELHSMPINGQFSGTTAGANNLNQ